MNINLSADGYENIFDGHMMDFAMGYASSDIFSYIIELILLITAYVIQSIALVKMLRTVGYKKPWLCWVPILNARALGDLADKYDDGKPQKNLGKKLMTYLIASATAAVLMGVMVFVFNAAVLSGVESYILVADMILLGAELATFIMLIIYMVYNYIALYKIYRIFSPSSATGLIVLSLFLNYASAVVLFLLRDKEPQNLRGQNGGFGGQDYPPYTPYNYDGND